MRSLGQSVTEFKGMEGQRPKQSNESVKGGERRENRRRACQQLGRFSHSLLDGSRRVGFRSFDLWPFLLAFLDFLGIQGFLILAVLGLLLYGERLPEVAASLGRRYRAVEEEFRGIRSEIQSVAFDAKQTVSRSMETAGDLAREEKCRHPSLNRRRPKRARANRFPNRPQDPIVRHPINHESGV